MSVDIQTVINLQYNSNTYLLKSAEESAIIYLIDIGNAEAVFKALKKNQKITAIFLTHAHYDHICGISQIFAKYPDCLLYCSAYTAEALADSKLNLSFYHKTPVSYQGQNVIIINGDSKINLFNNLNLQVLQTPGHNAGSLSFIVDKYIFTGDSLIPEFPVVTKLKSGNKLQAVESIQKIKNLSTTPTTIFPGHGKSFLAVEIDWAFYLKK